MIRRLLLLFLVAVSCLPLRAADASPAAPVVDPVQVVTHYHQVLARPEYQESAEPEVDSQLKDWLSLWFMKLGRRFGEIQYSGQMSAMASVFMTVLAIFAISGLFYVAVRLVRRRPGIDSEPAQNPPGPKTFRPPEAYDDEIEQAVGAGDWHAAWLASWRQFLSRLENRHLVEADRTRTNREYLAQLRAQTLPVSVLELLIRMVDSYDRTIYGRKTIDESAWRRFQEQIREAALLLHLSEKSPASPKREAA